jgi:hypothetical protein
LILIIIIQAWAARKEKVAYFVRDRGAIDPPGITKAHGLILAVTHKMGRCIQRLSATRKCFVRRQLCLVDCSG